MSQQPLASPATTTPDRVDDRISGGVGAGVSAGVGAARAAVVATLLVLGCLVTAAMVLWQPWGERNHFAYADLAPVRDAAWSGALLDGLGIAAIGISLSLAVCQLARTRGAIAATVGAVICAAGGVLFCTGMVSFTVLAWYATDVDAIPAASGTTLLSYVNDHGGHVMGPQIAGFLLFTLGSLVLSFALWRSRAVPAWLPIAFAVLTVGVFALSGTVLNVVQAIQLLTLLPVAWYLMRATRLRVTA
jgi:hypothetical protein